MLEKKFSCRKVFIKKHRPEGNFHPQKMTKLGWTEQNKIA